MKIVLVAALVCLALAKPGIRRVENLDSSKRIPGEFLVVLHAPFAQSTNVQYASSVAEKIAKISSKISVVKRFTNLRAPIFLIKTSEDAVVSSLFQIPEINSIVANAFEVMAHQCANQDSGSRLWGLSRISNRALPDFTSAQFSYDVGDGAGVRVYILDTSIRLTHQDFGGRAEFGFNAIGGGDGDQNGHGTHCAGTAAGTEFGVAKAATLVAVKVLGDTGGGTWDASIEGIDYAVGDLAARGQRGVISMSLGGGKNTATDSAVDSADAAGVPVVTSAGNSNSDACNATPAGASGAITVGNTEITDILRSTSSWGTCVDISAPGTDILSASHLSDTGTAIKTGTSMSCPLVAGVVAKYLSANRNASTSEVKAFLTNTATPGVIDLRGTVGTPNLLLYSTC